MQKMMDDHDVKPSAGPSQALSLCTRHGMIVMHALKRCGVPSALEMAGGGRCNRRKYCSCCPRGICDPVIYNQEKEDSSGVDNEESEHNDDGLKSLDGLYGLKLSEVKMIAKQLGLDDKDIDNCDDHDADTKDQVRSHSLMRRC
jgi:hypothetical protein